jgi:hypothetical protein
MARKFGCFFVVLLSGVTVFAATSGGISGFIKSSSGTPQIGAVVEIFTSAASMGTTVYTNGKGYYAADNLTPGLYQVKVSAATFLPSLRQNVTLRAGAHVLVNLTLSTLTDALKLIPDRRAPNTDPDDWHWTLNSAANRPVLRIFDKGPLVVVSDSESPDDHVLKARVAFIAGTDADGFGSTGEMTTAFALEKSLFSSGTLSFNGNIGASQGDANGVLRASYSHDFGDSSRPKLTVTYRHLASPGMVVQNAAYSAIQMTTSDAMSLAGFIDLNYGADVDSVQFARRVTAMRPFGSVDIHLSPDMQLEYRYATSEPNNGRAEKGFATAPADLSESGPRMVMNAGIPDVEHAHHQEVSVSRRFGDNNFQLGYYSDEINNMVLTGAGDPTAYSDNVLADIYSGTFSYSGGRLSTTGSRFVFQRKFSDDLTATLDYSTGGVIGLRGPVSSWQSVAQTLNPERQHSLGAKLSGYMPLTRTRWISSYKWTSGSPLSSVDGFNASAGQMDPYFSIFIRQPLPSSSLIPAKMEALIDVRNLLAQGYVPVLGQDGHTLYLVQSARALRAGLAFTF